MKKQSFKISINKEGGTQTVTGLVSKNFGIRKDVNQYSVTHLKTGYRTVAFPYQKQARAFVAKAEKLPKIETMDLDNAATFADSMLEIAKEVRNT